MDRRDELERWIAGSRSTQHALKRGLQVGGALAIAVMFVNRALGGIAIVVVAFVAAAGFWITNGHIAEWEAKIYKLDHPEKPSTGTTRKRRYEAD